MRSKFEYITIVIIHFLNHVLMFSLPVLILFLRDDINLTYTSTGYLWTILITVMTVLSLVTGSFADKYPEQRYKLIFVGLTIMISVWYFLRFGNSFVDFAVLFFVFGIGASVFHPASFAMITQLFEKDKAKALSFNMLAGMFANAASPWIFAKAERYYGNWQDVTTLVALASSIAGLISFFIVWKYETHSNKKVELEENERNGTGTWMKDIKFVFTPLIIIPLLYISLRSSFFRITSLFTPLLYEDYLNLSEYDASIATGLVLGFSSLFILVGGTISDKTHPKYAILISSIGVFVAATSLILVVDYNSLVSFTVSYLSLQALYYVGAPAASALLADRVGKDQRGKVFGASFSIGQILGVIAPSIFGILKDNYSLRTAFTFIFFLALVALFLGIYIFYEEGKRNRHYKIQYKG